MRHSRSAWQSRARIVIGVWLAIVLTGAVTSAGEIKYGIASWPEKGRGNHRALVRVTTKCDAVWAHIRWRRRDHRPDRKDIRVFDAATGARVTNVARINVNREHGDLVLQPQTVPGTYEVYYLPYDPPGTGPFGDAGNYFPPRNTADAAWLRQNGLTPEGIASGSWRELPKAEVMEIQARGDFHRMDPMEVIATKRETEQLLARHPGRRYLVFPEDRKCPIKVFEDIPLRWSANGPSEVFRGTAQPGEFYVFQIGVWACRASINGLALDFGRLTSQAGSVIPATSFRCLNLGGSDWLGRPFSRTFAVARGLVRPLWIGVQIPKEAKGRYRSAVRVRPQNATERTVTVELRVEGPVLDDAGDREARRLSRLRWLDSTLGLDDEVIPPYTPLRVDGNTVQCLGRRVVFGPLGLPERISSNHREVLAGPVRLTVETPAGPLQWSAGQSRVQKATPGVVEREAAAQSKPLALTVSSKMEFDGCLTYRAAMRAKGAARFKDIRLEVPVRREIAKYMMGMQRRGGRRPKEWKWTWDAGRADNMVWIGDVDAGLQLKLAGPRDVWELRKLTAGIPPFWGNGGKGGCDIVEEGEAVMLRAYTGARDLEAGEELELRFRFLITPFRPIDPNHWNWRYGDVKGDANIAHVHHGGPQNPYISYPFLTADRLAKYVASVNAIRHRQIDHGRLTYPAKGNLRLDRGALHLWVTVNFDPQAGAPRQARYNQSLVSLDFPNEDQLGLYWNIDDRGLRTYIRKGPPRDNRYSILFGSRSRWRKGEKHHLTLSWGEHLAIFVDGRRAASRRYRGTLTGSLEDAILWFRGGGFGIDAIKIVDVPFEQGVPVSASVDEHTLLLDTFSAWRGGTSSQPEKCAEGTCGQFEGAIETAKGVHGPEIRFSSRRVTVPPKGVNVYYTVRELSNHVAEMWALRSLGDEVFTTGGVDIYLDPRAAHQPFKGYPWLREHLVTGYEPRWRTKLAEGDLDAAIGMQGLSRWHNFYVEGLAWLMKTTGVDGLYLDGIGYDREIMRRVAVLG